MGLRQKHINYMVVASERDTRGITIQATYLHHFLELRYAQRETNIGFLWFGQVKVDAKPLWRSPDAFGCDTKEILDSEIQHQLTSWAVRLGYISFGP
ncbi:MAG: hypothetical protein AAB676_13055 [Verrucomicrobiota bacterium]